LKFVITGAEDPSKKLFRDRSEFVTTIGSTNHEIVIQRTNEHFISIGTSRLAIWIEELRNIFNLIL
jgi:hypothetical protein